ncbi:MAG: metallophosphoesterase [Candidatus Omnitrophota bacterium]|nr:metallophosphoesterase [Candidatus Omnitrophota bacterium]
MMIGVVSDTHIPDRADRIPERILEDFKNASLILHAGDLVELGVLETLRKICPNVKAVQGNMDPASVRKILPEKEVIEINGKRIGLIHGSGHPNKLMDFTGEVFKNEKVDVIVFGHSHTPTNETRAGVLYFNPGSPTDKIFSPYNSYGILEIIDGKIEGKIIRL